MIVIIIVTKVSDAMYDTGKGGITNPEKVYPGKFHAVMVTPGARNVRR